MTIAICYLTPEGVVLGSDSTATVTYGPPKDGPHFLRHQQKIFEVGTESTLAIAHWGLSNFSDKSVRTMVAELGDVVTNGACTTFQDVASRLEEIASAEYAHVRRRHHNEIGRFKELHELRRQRQGGAERRRLAEGDRAVLERLTELMSGLHAGFFLAGYLIPARTPAAAVLSFNPLEDRPTLRRLDDFGYEIAGEDFIAIRMFEGIDKHLSRPFRDTAVAADVAAAAEAMLISQRLTLPILPIREAADFVWSTIHATIKAIKFSQRTQTCGGPIEVAVITTDRKFRWIRHKSFESAIIDGEPS